MKTEISQVFLNLKVQDLDRSRNFFSSLGFSFDERFSGELAICVNINHTVKAMLLVENHFKNFTSKNLADAHQVTEVLISLGLNSKQEVIDFYNLAISLGATEAAPFQDHGFMYGRSFHDLDGHIWELGWMDLEAFMKINHPS
jgi:predicted lactoylglutathione lyase